MGFAAGDTNLYRYAGNSHPNATDPSGHVAANVVAGGVGAVVGGLSAGLYSWYMGDDAATIAGRTLLGAAVGFGVGFTFGAASAFVLGTPGAAGATGLTLWGTEAATVGTWATLGTYSGAGLLSNFVGQYASWGATNLGKPHGEPFHYSPVQGLISAATGPLGMFRGGGVPAASWLSKCTPSLAREAGKTVGFGVGTSGISVGIDSIAQAGEMVWEGRVRKWDWNRTKVAGVTGFLAGAGLRALIRTCFAAGTPLLTPYGAKSIELFQPGDFVLSRDEHDPLGEVRPQMVEEVFERHSQVLTLVVAGQSIVTTGEHPFWAEHRGWTAASELSAGERLLGHDGVWVPIDGIEVGETWAVVYNLRVAEDHTYFVGCAEWGFSIWAHNLCEGMRNTLAGHVDEAIVQSAWRHAEARDFRMFRDHLRQNGVPDRAIFDAWEATGVPRAQRVEQMMRTLPDDAARQGVAVQTPIQPGLLNRPHPELAIDTRLILNPRDTTAQNFPRDGVQYWRMWMDRHPETISPTNRALIEGRHPVTGTPMRNPLAPRVDSTWVRWFPEHSGFLGLPFERRGLVHHHAHWVDPVTGMLQPGPHAFPVPQETHRGFETHWHG